MIEYAIANYLDDTIPYVCQKNLFDMRIKLEYKSANVNIR